MKNSIKLVAISAIAVFAFTSIASVSADYSEKKKGMRTEKTEITEEQKAAMEAHRAALEEAVKNNDYETFSSLREENRAEKEANRSDDAPEREGKEELSEEEMKAKFDEMVLYYNENGELPKKEMKKRRKGSLNDSQKGKVKRVLKNLNNPEKVEKILAKVTNKIELLEASDMEEERKEKILGMLEGIRELLEESLSESE